MGSVKEDRMNLLQEIKALPPGPLALEKIAYLRSEYDSAIDDYRNSLNILSDTTYQDRKHFLLELIQNADDARFDNNEPCLNFTVYDDRLELFYNEFGFDTSDVIAITGTGSSTKALKRDKAKSFIGEKGIGFKSVFALASEVEIESPPWHFKLTKDNIIIPQVLYNGSLQLGDGTRLVVRFTDKTVVESVAKELLKFVSGQTESFLFLQKISKFVVEDRRFGKIGAPFELSIQPSSRSGDVITLHSLPEDNHRMYALYTEELDFPPELAAARWERMSGITEPLTRTLTVAALTNPSTFSYGRLFCFLPTEVRLPVPFFLQLDGHLKADRERLHDPENNKWNRYLLAHVPRFLVNAILHWRGSAQISDKLLKYVPVDVVIDQMSSIFQSVMTMLRAEPWVRTFDECDEPWVKPGDALVADPFWTKYFNQYPKFRADVELVLGKRFVYPQWVFDARWGEIGRKYEIRTMSPEQQAELLTSNLLPSELTQSDTGLMALYEHFTRLLKNRESSASDLRNKLLRAPIFPIGQGKFGALIDSFNNIKPYWVSSRSRRSTGLESHNRIRVVDSDYTYHPDVNRDTTENRAAEIRAINERNELVRNLLKGLKVPELNDETLLTDLQIPYLLSQPNTEKVEERFSVLAQIFEAYRAKRTYDDDYLRQLSKLKDALVPSESGVVTRICNLLLPPALRLLSEDHLFERTSLHSLALSNNLLNPPELPGTTTITAQERNEERNRKWREDLRDFLVNCGICAAPRFLLHSRTFDGTSSFQSEDPIRYRKWKKRVEMEYTVGNALTVEVAHFDDATKELLKSNSLGEKNIAIAIYEAWKKYSGLHIVFDFETLTYRHRPPVGCFKVTYKRREQRSILLDDTDWGGISRNKIPLETISGNLVYASDALRLPRVTQGIDFNYCCGFFPIVHETNLPEKFGYWNPYINSLHVSPIQTSHINHMWQHIGASNRDDYVKAIVELVRAGVSTVDLRLYDKETDTVRPIHEFRLGKPAHHEVPYIEQQYGETGRILGELVGLRVESEATVFCERMERYLRHELTNHNEDENHAQLASLILSWNKMALSDRRDAMVKVPTLLRQFDQVHPLLLVINNVSLAAQLRSLGRVVIELTVPSGDMPYYEEAARDIGFQTTRDLGTLEYRDKKPLMELEREKFAYLLSGYVQLLESEERARFLLNPLGFDKSDVVVDRVVRASGLIKRVSHEITIPVSLPYFDDNENVLVVRNSDSLEEILARLISSSGFTTYRSARRDIEDIPKQPKKPAEIDTIDLVDSTGKVDNELPTTSLEQVKHVVNAALIDERNATSEIVSTEWNLGLDPSEELHVRDVIREGLAKSIESGPVLQDKKKRDHKESKGFDIPDGMKLVDKDAGDPKEFLLAQYNGKCQVCATELILSNGGKWVEIFHIAEGRDQHFWIDRPFNILGLCPNCNALAKYGGGLDLSSLVILAKETIEGKAFAIEVPDFNGDFYVTTIQLNSRERRLVYSKLHVAHLSGLLGDNQENLVANE